MTTPIPGPQPNAETQAFWDAAARGELLVKRCDACRRTHWYPRAVCPHCFGSSTRWEVASGRGQIHSFTVVRRVAAPYVIAYVTLAEGTTMLTNIVECDVAALRVGREVRVVFVPADNGMAVPMFTPA